MNLSFLLIKPDAVKNGYTDKIIEYLKKAGFEIVARKPKVLSRIDEMFLCPMHIGQNFFDDLVAFMTSGPSELCIVRKEFANKELDKLVGITDPHKNNEETLRGKFGTSIMRNAVHSPNSDENAVREILYFFPEWGWDEQRAI